MYIYIYIYIYTVYIYMHGNTEASLFRHSISLYQFFQLPAASLTTSVNCNSQQAIRETGSQRSVSPANCCQLRMSFQNNCLGRLITNIRQLLSQKLCQWCRLSSGINQQGNHSYSNHNIVFLSFQTLSDHPLKLIATVDIVSFPHFFVCTIWCMQIHHMVMVTGLAMSAGYQPVSGHASG
jgi:hypothetical protein